MEASPEARAIFSPTETGSRTSTRPATTGRARLMAAKVM